MGRAGTQVWEAGRSQTWHTGCQSASSSEGTQHTPQQTWRQAPGLFPLELVHLKVSWPWWLGALVGQPPLDKAGELSQPCSRPGHGTCALRKRASGMLSIADFSPELWPGH